LEAVGTTPKKSTFGGGSHLLKGVSKTSPNANPRSPPIPLLEADNAPLKVFL